MNPTTDELSRLIAESIEPLRTLDVKAHIEAFGYARGTQCWMISDHDEFAHFVPRDMTTDPAMPLMLLEQILASGKMVQFSRWNDGSMNVCCIGSSDEGVWTTEFYAAAKTKEEALATAYARWKGLLK
jgi:hypothetical protein